MLPTTFKLSSFTHGLLQSAGGMRSAAELNRLLVSAEVTAPAVLSTRPLQLVGQVLRAPEHHLVLLCAVVNPLCKPVPRGCRGVRATQRHMLQARHLYEAQSAVQRSAAECQDRVIACTLQRPSKGAGVPMCPHLAELSDQQVLRRRWRWHVRKVAHLPAEFQQAVTERKPAGYYDSARCRALLSTYAGSGMIQVNP